MRLQSFVLFAILVLGVASPAVAHVNLVTPNGGDTFEVGDNVEISWSILIAHSLQNWDLWYSTVGATGPWIELAVDLPAGSPAAGSLHSYDWVVSADAVAPQVWFRVRMDNGGFDYFDVSDAPSTVVDSSAPIAFVRGDVNEDASVNLADAVATLSYLFVSPTVTPGCLETADTNGDTQVNIGDAVYMLSYLFVAGSPAPAGPFPSCGAEALTDGPGCLIGSCIP